MGGGLGFSSGPCPVTDDYDTPGPGKRLANRVAGGVLLGMAALILAHCTLGWP